MRVPAHRHFRKRIQLQAWHKLARTGTLLTLLLIALGLASQFQLFDRLQPDFDSAFIGADSSDAIHVVTRVGPNTYFKSENGPGGFEYSLLKSFASAHDKQLVIHTADTLDELFELVTTAQVDFASAGLTPTAQREQRFLFSSPYMQNQPIVVYRVGSKRPRNYQDLVASNLVVIANSSHSAALTAVQGTHPKLQWREVENVDFNVLLGWVEQGVVDYTIIDSAEFMLHQGTYPRVKRAFSFGSEQSFNWMFAKTDRGRAFRKAADRFIKNISNDGTLAKLEERHFGQSQHVNQVAANEFAKNINSRLPLYIDNIKRVASEFNMDWRLLAAISYQESSWNPRAISPTGVRGMMMLTLPTAKEVGVTNRLDLDQSLQGGALYYHRLKERLPERIVEPDRSWLALAAYNVGYGHLEDARRLTQERGQDPDSWYAVKDSLPLLTEPEWYNKTRYGYARGYEPVHYVQRIRHYHNVLMWKELADNLREEARSSEALFARQDAFADDNQLLGQDLTKIDPEITNTLASASDVLSTDTELAIPTSSL